MESGSFQIGEDVEGFGISPAGSITFRTAQPNHKRGTYNSPTGFFTTNPYDTSVTIPESYTESSTILLSLIHISEPTRPY